jgi:membrane-associated phospholipid phosphatase
MANFSPFVRAGIFALALAAIAVLPSQPAAAQSAAADTGSSEAIANAPTPGESAQTTGQIDSPTSPGIVLNDRCDLLSSIGTCLLNIMHDQAGIWTSPMRIRGRQAAWLLPFAGATVLAFEYDKQAMPRLNSTASRIRISNDFTRAGSGYVLAGAAGATYTIGKLTHNERVRETGVLALEALADAGIVSEVLKLATNRQRPFVPPGTGRFWPDDTDIYTVNGSFPSGHATATWAFAHLVADETPGHPWLHVGLYALATAVSAGRVTGQDHFPSDVVVGSVLGYLIGGYVYRHNSGFYRPSKSLSVTPIYNPATSSYGVAFSFPQN